jgi:hypothetical protein
MNEFLEINVDIPTISAKKRRIKYKSLPIWKMIKINEKADNIYKKTVTLKQKREHKLRKAIILRSIEQDRKIKYSFSTIEHYNISYDDYDPDIYYDDDYYSYTDNDRSC